MSETTDIPMTVEERELAIRALWRYPRIGSGPLIERLRGVQGTEGYIPFPTYRDAGESE